MKALLAAISFLTIIPAPCSGRIGERDIEESLPFFPVVGLLIGILVATGDLFISSLLPALPASVLTVLLLLVITGGLHMDGLADTADGIFSVRVRERMLEIMRDSRIGAMGVMAIVFVLALKIAALTSLPVPERSAAIILMPLGGRLAMLFMLTALPYARRDGGLATLFLRRRSWWHPLWGGIFLAATAWLLSAAGWSATLWAGLAVVLTGFFAVLLVSWYIYRKLGGFTGDTLGAAAEITETLMALAGAVCLLG